MRSRDWYTNPTSSEWTYQEALNRPSGSTCELMPGFTEQTLLCLPDESRVYVVKDANGQVLPPPFAERQAQTGASK